MEKDKQIEEITCKKCVHYEVCMYVNAKAVEFARAEKCKLFKDVAGYRKASDIAEDIIRILRAAGINEWRYPVIAELKKKYKDTSVNTDKEEMK